MSAAVRGRALPFAGALFVLAVGCDAQHTSELTGAARAGGTPTYLALGDSVAFGLDPHLVPPAPFSCFSCGTFTGAAPPRSGDVFVGYPEYLQQRLGAALVNASCPGETTVSFAKRIRAGQAAICAEFKSEDWLHVDYDGTQRSYTLDALSRLPRVELVTLQIGANDVLDLVFACGADPACVNGGIGGVLATVYANVSDVLSSIRRAGYRGSIVVPGYYAPSPAWDELVPAVNQYLALAASGSGAVFVDLRTLFGADPCGDGWLIPVDPLDPAAGCDMHPSAAGAQLIASAIASAIGR